MPFSKLRSIATRATLAAFASLCVPAALAAQVAAPDHVDTSYFGAVKWRNIGPNSAGRMVAVGGSAARPNEYYMGTTGGGVWKTTDGGKTAEPVSDGYFGGSIGAIAVSESNPDVVYVGGGETPIRGNVSYGDGVWKTTDGGKTWQHMGLEATQQIGRIRIDPRNNDVAYVAALGHVWAPNPERGVYKTTDGGKTWKKILFRNDSTGAIDLVMDPSNPDVLYASLWQAGRKPWLLVSGGAGSGIFKTTDGGEHWTEITHNPGLPSGVIGNIGLAVSPVKPSRVWALIENEPKGGVYRSDDAGATWQYLNDSRDLRQRAWYFSMLFADTQDSNTVYAPNVGPEWSQDGGKTFTRSFGGGDNHVMWIAPNDDKRMIVGHDNGAIITTDGGQTSTRVEIPTGQFYHAYLTNDFPYHVCGAKQDAGSSCGPVREQSGGRGFGGGGRGRGGAAASPYSTFYGIAGGESGYVAGDPLDPEITYGGNYSGVLEKMDRGTGLSVRLDPWPLNPMGHSAEDSKYRIQWTYPIMNSPHDPHVLYVGANVLFKSSDDGATWKVISPDLTRHDPATLGPSGGPITKDQTSIEYYGTIFAVQESPITPGLIWTGSDDGLIYLTRDGGKTWNNVTPKGLPSWMRISIIDPSPHAPGTAWVAANRYQMDDYAPYLYKTTDYGKTWTKIVNGLPGDVYTRAIREDLVRPNMLYASTERGMWLSYDAGAHWQSLQRNLPPVPVHDIALRDDDIVIATHGRAFWVMEGISQLRQAPEAEAAAGHNFLYQPGAAYQGTNVDVTYRLTQAGQPVTLEFLEKNGTVIKKFSSTDKQPAGRGGRGGRRGGFGGPAVVTDKAGLNTYAWNMRYDDASDFQGMLLWSGGTTGPDAAPGTYTIRLTVGDAKPLTTTFTVKKDPRTRASDADLVEQHNFAIRVRDQLTAANDNVKRIRSVKRQLDERAPAMKDNAAYGKLAATFADSLGGVEDSLYQTKNKSGEDPLNFPVRLNDQLAGLLGFVENGDRRPPPQAYQVYNTLDPLLRIQLTRLDKVMKLYLDRVNAALKAAGQAPIVPTTEEPPAAAGGGIS